MRKYLLFTAAALALSACDHGSGGIRHVSPYNGSDTGHMTFGIVGDSQFQSIPNWANEAAYYRNERADKLADVTFRPPLLDYASRDLLIAHLTKQADAGAQAIFFLGDGANHGCKDEFLGWEGEDDLPSYMTELQRKGVLTILSDFRDQRQAEGRNAPPIFFVIGNHDFLAAGSTERIDTREAVCGEGNYLTKEDVIRAVEAHNRAMVSHAGQEWSYESSFDSAEVAKDCATSWVPPKQSRRRGCYLAATLDYRPNGEHVRFLLIDSTDYADVSQSGVGSIDLEGLRGGVSFADGPNYDGANCASAPADETSQTCWLARRSAATHVGASIGLSHYDFDGFRNYEPIIGATNKTAQRLGDLYRGKLRGPKQNYQDVAYFLSAHTHTPAQAIPTKVGGFFSKKLLIEEVNSGSTTDFPNVSTLIRLTPRGAQGEPAMSFEQLSLEAPDCGAMIDILADTEFDHEVLGVKSGLDALGIANENPRAYRAYGQEDVDSLLLNATSVTGVGDTQERHDRTICLGLKAAEVEGPPH